MWDRFKREKNVWRVKKMRQKCGQEISTGSDSTPKHTRYNTVILYLPKQHMTASATCLQSYDILPLKEEEWRRSEHPYRPSFTNKPWVCWEKARLDHKICLVFHNVPPGTNELLTYSGVFMGSLWGSCVWMYSLIHKPTKTHSWDTLKSLKEKCRYKTVRSEWKGKKVLINTLIFKS